MATESVVAVTTEAPVPTRVTSLTEQGFAQFLLARQTKLVDSGLAINVDELHTEYLKAKYSEIKDVLANPDSIVEPKISEDEIIALKKEMLDTDYHKPQFEDMSYLDYLAFIVEPKGDNLFLTYLIEQKKIIKIQLDKMATPMATTGVSETAPEIESTPQTDANIEKKKRNARRVVICTVMGLLVAAGAFTAHKLGIFNGMLGIVQNDLIHPTPTLSPPATEETITPPPTPDAGPAYISTAIPLKPAEKLSTPEKNYSFPMAETIYNNPDKVADIDFIILGADKTTAAIKNPNVRASRALDFANPRAILHFDKEKGSWQIMILPTDTEYETITVINNVKGPEGIQLTGNELAIYPKNWQTLNKDIPESGGAFHAWAVKTILLVDNGDLYFPKNMQTGTAADKGPTIHYREKPE